MEFLRFGSSIPGSYWGCCAVDIIQNFKVDPDSKASIEYVNGDSGDPKMVGRKKAFLGKTYKEIFLQRLRVTTFNGNDMPNHAFFAVLTDTQIKYDPGKKWLAILKEQGFEFVRTVDNSVYSGSSLHSAKNPSPPHKNYIFALYRNVGRGSVDDPFTPPKEWSDLPSVVPEPWEHIQDRVALAESIRDAQLPLWEALPAKTWYTEEELEKDGVPITYAGRRSKLPQQLKQHREQAQKSANAEASPPKAAPFTKVSKTEEAA